MRVYLYDIMMGGKKYLGYFISCRMDNVVFFLFLFLILERFKRRKNERGLIGEDSKKRIFFGGEDEYYFGR